MARKRDQLDPEQLRQNLLRLAELIRRLDEQGELLEASPRLIRYMGNLRAQLFEYEVRHTGRLLPAPQDAPEVLEAQRIIEEAARRIEEAERRWGHPWTPEGDEEEDA